MLALMFVSGGLVGVVLENARKRHDLHLDADRGVTFIDGEPHFLKRYGPEEHYPED